MLFPLGSYIGIPKPRIGHNQKGTTWEPLGMANLKVNFRPGRRAQKPSPMAALQRALKTRSPDLLQYQLHLIL